ncbi:MAG: hypothetical protein OXE05_01435 [Chloroflexi bacterium]|nr:hypothetical protein [Chloroflexota bacterium]
MFSRQLVRRTGVTAALVAVGMVLLTMPLLAHYFLGHSAVDDGPDGREIRWLDYTQYDDARQWRLTSGTRRAKSRFCPKPPGTS